MKLIITSMKNIIDRRNAEFIPLIEGFKKELAQLNIKGITGPHFPGVGECYENAKYRFAFCGMETYGWNEMQDFMSRDANDYLKDSDDCLNQFQPLGWASNWHATFWGFVFKFLARFYHVDFCKLVDKNASDKEVQSILKSFVWAQANSIERYEVTSQWAGAEQQAWNAVKTASRKFDDLNHIINSCAPKVVFIVYSGANEDYFMNDDTLSSMYNVDAKHRKNCLRLSHAEIKYDYYYLRNSSTHVFKLPHPTWMGLYSGIGIDAYVDSLIKDIETYHIWDSLPVDQDVFIFPKAEENHLCLIDEKYHIIASIAHSLTQNNIVMYGGDIASLFKMNNILTQYGAEYSEDNSRGIFKVISNAWKYYYDKGDFQAAYEIARSFVNKYGEYAY